ncbi:MAG: CbbQ/NirQ/NorQ C-terminal domain-containing protein, partial [Rhizobiaceae bacterium]|nr:CbbQ/NirQ/NorQ C-terminal domain-containing protein [Rhizobiaceae bacterium]
AARGIPLAEACQVAMVLPITDDQELRAALTSAIAACL